MNLLKSIFLFVLAISLTSCSNPAGGSDDHEHDVHGAVLKMNDQEIVRVEEGVVTSGEISVAEGEDTPTISIYFLAEDGDEFRPHEDEYELRWEVGNNSVATIAQHSSAGAWEFHVSGETQGGTDVVFTLWHSTEGHAALNTPPITINVN